MVHEFGDYDPDLTPEGMHQGFLAETGKVRLDKWKWDEIERFLRIEFNQRLKLANRRHRSLTWKKGTNYVHRLFGKELMVLAWAIEDAEKAAIAPAVENWLGLRPEERWWLYTITNAATGHPIQGQGRGWRKALRFALTENPIPEGRYTQALLDEEKATLFEEEQDFGNA